MYLKFSAHAYFRTRNSNLKSVSNKNQLEISRNLIRDNRINQAEKGYGVSDHYVNSLKHLYVYVSNDIMQYLRWRQSSVKRRETGKLLHSFLKCFSFFVRDFFSL